MGKIMYILIFVPLFITALPVNPIGPLNVCKTFSDYYYINPINCWHNPDLYINPIDIIRRHGYPVETFEIESNDGYISTIVRMPKTNRNGLVLLEPPATGSHSGWIDKGVNDSLGFLLWDAGYEVWLANPRGTRFGQRHRSLYTNSSIFWDYSFHEIALQDIPAHVAFIANHTNAKSKEITIIGFSLGATAIVVYASLVSKQTEKYINVVILMGVNTEIHTKLTWLKEICKGVDYIEEIFKALKIYSIGTYSELSYNLLSVCRSAPLIPLCVVFDLIIMGFDPEGEPAEWFPIKYSQNPSGVSTKVFFHYMQIIKYERFQYYDYGLNKNIEVYNATIPPLYPLQNINIPVYILQAERDILVSLEDIQRFYAKLPNKAKKYGYRLVKGFGHGSFYYGKHASKQVYGPIISFLNSFKTHP